MKKRRLHQNVIPFPQLEKRLLKKGIAYLHEGRFDEAIELFQEAREWIPEHPELLYSLISAFIQKGQLDEAKDIVEMMLRQGIGDYLSTMEIYIGILFQMGQYRAVKEYVSMLLEEQQIPFSKMEQYYDFIEICRTLMKKEAEVPVSYSQKNLPENLFFGNWNEVIQNITNLTEEDLPRYIHAIHNFLKDDSQNFFIKTVLLNVLYEMNYTEVLTVKKFGKTVNVRLSDYAPPQEAPFAIQVKNYIENVLAHENPSLMNNVLILAERFFFNIYPLEKDFTDVPVWAEALIAVVKSYIEGVLPPSSGPESLKVQEAVHIIMAVEEKFNLPFD